MPIVSPERDGSQQGKDSQAEDHRSGSLRPERYLRPVRDDRASGNVADKRERQQDSRQILTVSTANRDETYCNGTSQGVERITQLRSDILAATNSMRHLPSVY